MNAHARTLSWVPTLYFAEGLPYVIVMTVAGIMYKNLGLSNAELALYTSWLYLPWVIKPLWSPVVDTLRTRREWTWATQAILALGLLGIGLSLSSGNWLQLTLIFLWLMAITSATHDIAADGFYMLALDDNQQAFYVGFRSTFYRIAMWAGEGGMLILAGYLAGEDPSFAAYTGAWRWTFLAAGAVLGLLALYHGLVLPQPSTDRAGHRQQLWGEMGQAFVSFFQKSQIGLVLAFLLLYRLGEAQLVKLAGPFLLDTNAAGGLGLSTEAVGWINGTVGVGALIAGGILGGILAARYGLKAWFWPMILAMNLPNLAYWLLAVYQPENELWVTLAVGLEKFGYGFGFTAFVLYLLYVARGNHPTAHYAIGTGFMALGMMLPGLISGYVQEWLGYPGFFLWVLGSTLPGMALAWLVWRELDPAFGRKN